MTHGDKAKAKAAKSTQASVKKAGPQGGENGKSKAAGQAVKAAGQGKAGQAGKAGEGVKAGAKKGSGPAKESTSRPEPKAKGSSASTETAGGFANPAISAAFRQALKKYPNALRKLTD